MVTQRPSAALDRFDGDSPSWHLDLGRRSPPLRRGENDVTVATSATEEWEELTARFESYVRVPAAQANARLLRRAAPVWSDRLVARGSMHDVIFTVPGDEYPFTEQVRLRSENDTYEFVLFRGRLVVTADRCLERNALSVLDAFLSQLESSTERGDQSASRTRSDCDPL